MTTFSGSPNRFSLGSRRCSSTRYRGSEIAIRRRRSSQLFVRAVGSGRGVPENSSSIICLQSATHASQIMMLKVGPAMSLLTWSCRFPQKEQR
jgi:hypothetical protein